MAQDADLRLLKDCLAGGDAAWEAFVRRFAPFLGRVCRHALRRCRRPSGPQEVEDMLQAVFLAFLQHDRRVLRGYEGQGTVEAYLAAVAVRRVLDDRSLRTQAGPLPVAAAGDDAPGAALEAREALAILERQLDRLAPRARLALRLQARGATLQEIAAALGLLPDAAGRLLSRARAEVRDRFADPRE